MITRIALLGIGALLVIGAALAFGRGGGLNSSAASLDPALRTVVVLAPGEQAPDLRGTDEAVNLLAGTLPAGMQRATVLTDTDCAADDQGVSHCRNDLQIGHMQLAIRHHHKMVEVPCFSPTEQLNVVDVATYATLPTALP